LKDRQKEREDGEEDVRKY